MSFRYFSSWIGSSSQSSDLKMKLGAQVYVFDFLLSLWFLWSYFRVALNWRICDDWVDHFALVSYRYLDALQSINMDLTLLCTIDQVHLLSEGVGVSGTGQGAVQFSKSGIRFLHHLFLLGSLY